MIALQITDVKNFMAQFLAGNAFDDFLLSEGSVTTFCTFSIDGSWQRAFDEDSAVDNANTAPLYVPWSRLREHCFSVIRGRKTPLGFKFVFLLSREDQDTFLAQNALSSIAEQVTGLYMNLSFRESRLLLTTGTARKDFSTDRTLDRSWDEHIRAFLQKNGIAFEEIA